MRATASVSFGDDGDDDETTREKTPQADATADDGERPSGDAADDRNDEMDQGNTDADETAPGGKAGGDAASPPLCSISNSLLPESESNKRRGARDSEGVVHVGARAKRRAGGMHRDVVVERVAGLGVEPCVKLDGEHVG